MCVICVYNMEWKFHFAAVFFSSRHFQPSNLDLLVFMPKSVTGRMGHPQNRAWGISANDGSYKTARRDSASILRKPYTSTHPQCTIGRSTFPQGVLTNTKRTRYTDRQQSLVDLFWRPRTITGWWQKALVTRRNLSWWELVWIGGGLAWEGSRCELLQIKGCWSERVHAWLYQCKLDGHATHCSLSEIFRPTYDINKSWIS